MAPGHVEGGQRTSREALIEMLVREGSRIHALY
jgi:hypothetical protein